MRVYQGQERRPTCPLVGLATCTTEHKALRCRGPACIRVEDGRRWSRFASEDGSARGHDLRPFAVTILCVSYVLNITVTVLYGPYSLAVTVLCGPYSLSIKPCGAEDQVASASKSADVGAVSPLRTDAPGDTTSPVNKTKKGSKSKQEERVVLNSTPYTLNAAH